jgi:hypothetical protein
MRTLILIVTLLLATSAAVAAPCDNGGCAVGDPPSACRRKIVVATAVRPATRRSARRRRTALTPAADLPGHCPLASRVSALHVRCGWCCVSPMQPVDPPSLKWSELRYVFDIKEDCNGKEAIQA